MKTAVIALGGNALIRAGQKGTLEEQMNNVETAMEHIVKLVKKGFRVVITHGNGPQSGAILLQNEIAKKTVPQMPLYVCVAESQAQIGYMIQETLYNKLHELHKHIPVVTVVTQVLVDRKDTAFQKPTKPIGPFYPSKSKLPKSWDIVRTPKGFRRVVPSPDPKEIIEADAIRNIISRAVVIACGGGGIPVVRSTGVCYPGASKEEKRFCASKGLYGVDAVIDKDLAGQKLCEVVKADYFFILTDVEQVSVNFGKPSEKKLGKTTLSQIKKYNKEGHFPPGSMGPKIKAAIRFLERGGRQVVITSFEKLEQSLEGKAGTIIMR